MGISGVIQIAKQYFLVGIVGALILTVVFLIGYFLVYKKQMKGTKKLNPSKMALGIILFIYIIIVMGATIGDRTTINESVNLHLFSSYIEAYNSFSLSQWRNIILNILMFVPLGFILPLLFKKCERWYITYSIGLGATLFIEALQYISKRGVFELDDIVNNALGCIIGYGVIMLIKSIFRRKEKREKNSTIIAYQIPLMVTIISFSTIFITYYNQELGNLSFSNSYKIDMSEIEVSSKMNLENKPEKTYVYKAFVGNKEDATVVAKEVFSKLDTNIDESQNDEYDDSIVFQSEEGNYTLWVYYKGLTTWFIDEASTKGKENLKFKEVKNLLSKFDIELPKEATFKENGDGNYSVSLNMVKSNDVYLDGELSCTIGKNGQVTEFTNNIISYKAYKEYEIISAKEAYDKILNGEFSVLGELEKNSKIDVVGVSLNYELDSKGLYQPVYDFEVKGNGKINNIFIPALKLY